jgi:hypothetical protein
MEREVKNHGTPYGYKLGCRCEACTSAKTAYTMARRRAQREKPLAPDDPRHGTVNGYNNLWCRCEACKAAAIVSMLDGKRRRHERGLPPDDPRHGTYSGYCNYGCRCPDCTTAWSTYNRELRRSRKREQA